MSLRVLSALVAVLVAGGLPALAADLCPPKDLQFLEGLTRAVIDAARVRRGESRPGCAARTNTCADAIITPGGCYPSFWIRDFAMSVPSGLIPPAELAGAVRLTFGAQADAAFTCRSGAIVPKGAIPDHIRFDGAAVFFPGTYDPEKQGGVWGLRPPHDDAYYAILMAGAWVRRVGSSAPLDETIRGVPLLERMDWAFASSDVAKDGTELAWADAATRGVGFGFCDSITHTGHLLFASILRWQAARRLAELHAGGGDAAASARYAVIADRIAAAVPRVFGRDDGWLVASTGKSAQKDVWGTAYAVWTGLLQGEARQKAARALAQALKAGTIAEMGNIRHVPTDGDFSEKTAWEVSREPVGTYQNGAYWGTPSGWVAAAAAEVDADAARQLVADYIAELRAGDFRLGAGHRSPLECFLTRTRHARNPVYMTSVTCPYAVLSELSSKGKNIGARRNPREVKAGRSGSGPYRRRADWCEATW